MLIRGSSPCTLMLAATTGKERMSCVSVNVQAISSFYEIGSVFAVLYADVNA